MSPRIGSRAPLCSRSLVLLVMLKNSGY
jgi:hypothetical protein